MATDSPQFSFGVIADIQYADIDDGHNYAMTVQRFYRRALAWLQLAITVWQSDTISRPSFVLQLGDIIDGHNRRRNASDSALRAVLDKFTQFAGPVYHVWGNHEYYNFSRKTLLESQLYSGRREDSTPVEGKVYYSVEPHPQLRILVLDCYEISVLASPRDSQDYQTALQCLEANTNADKNSAEGLAGEMGRFVKFNGAVSEQQLVWVEENLEAARDLRQNVILIGHCPVYGPGCDVTCLCWNAAAILRLLHAHRAIVLAYIAGHDHRGGCSTDPVGILHLVMPGVIENGAAPDFATAYVRTDTLTVVGNGRVANVTVPLRYPLNARNSI